MKNQVPVEVSARHVHLNQEALEDLFGSDYNLTYRKELSQPGQFACYERVSVVGPKGRIDNVIVLGPLRPQTQVEVSLTDARMLGIEAFVRESGDIAGTNGCELVSLTGSTTIKNGVIAAKRHLHVNEEEAEQFGLKDKEVIGIEVANDTRSLVFNDVVVRVNPQFRGAVHIDTDEANAAAFSSGFGTIVK